MTESRRWHYIAMYHRFQQHSHLHITMDVPQVLTQLALVASMAPYSLLIVPFLLPAYSAIYQRVRIGARDTRRIEGVAHTPGARVNESSRACESHVIFDRVFDTANDCYETVWCRVVQWGAVCCSVVECVAVCCSVLQCVAVRCSVLQCVAVSCIMLQWYYINSISTSQIQKFSRVVVCCSVLQCVAVCCNVWLWVVVCCSDIILIVSRHVKFRSSHVLHILRTCEYICCIYVVDFCLLFIFTQIV